MSNPLDLSGFTHDQLPGRIVFGAGRRHDAPDELAAIGATRVLFIGGSHDETTINDLAGRIDLESETIVGVRAHVPAQTVRDALRVVDRFESDVVVAIGGGSATGLGKIVARDRDVKLVAIPTTYAGSEMTPIWGMTEAGVKTTGRALRVLPVTVLYDPELTIGLPRSVTVNSTFNAIAHCVEALWLPNTSPITQETAIAAVRVLTSAVDEVAEVLDDIDARTRLLYGAHRAGSVLAAAGTGLLHQTAHVLGGMFDLDHGAMYAVLTPLMVEHHLRNRLTATTALTAALGHDPASVLRDLADDVDAPRSLSEIGFPPSRLTDAIVAVAEQTDTEPAHIGPVLTAAMGITTKEST